MYILTYNTAPELLTNPKAWGPGSLKSLFFIRGNFHHNRSRAPQILRTFLVVYSIFTTPVEEKEKDAKARRKSISLFFPSLSVFFPLSLSLFSLFSLSLLPPPSLPPLFPLLLLPFPPPSFLRYDVELAVTKVFLEKGYKVPGVCVCVCVSTLPPSSLLPFFPSSHLPFFPSSLLPFFPSSLSLSFYIQ